VLILIVAGGPEKGRIHELREDQELVIGRDGPDLQFADPKMSRRHARLWCVGGRWHVQDLGSRHGTHRNHQKIEAQIQPLKDGDYLQIGRTVLVVARRSEAATAAPPAESPRHMRWLAGLAAAAVAAIAGLNVANLLQTQRGVDELEQRVTAQAEDAQQQDQARSQRVEQMIARIDQRQQTVLPQLDTMLAMIEDQPDVVGPLRSLAAAVERRDDDPQIDQKLDAALALLREQGGNARVMSRQIAAALAEPPDAPGGDALEPLLREVLAKVQRLEEQPGNEQVLTALAEVRDTLPADPTERLDRVLAQVEAAPAAEQLAEVQAQLASIQARLADREDAQLMQAQLARLIDSAENEAAAARAVSADPVLGQILSQMQALTERDQKLDQIIASLEQQPYQNRAMLDEVLTRLDGDTSEQVVAALLDQAMAELRGKSITDADQLRRLIERQVVAAVGRAVGEPVPVDHADESRLTRTEVAYKRAFETGRRITIGVALNPVTGERSAGRTLNPADARAAGHRSWRDWYLMDDLAHRMQLSREAQRLAGSNNQADGPTTAGAAGSVSASPAP
jgi:pSer/pThr/pTyr-binding forkhead associated (FHA) protein